MTCIEKLRELHLDWDDEKVEYYVRKHCVAGPVCGYIMSKPDYCSPIGWPYDVYCERCWNREVDDKCNWFEIRESLTGEDMRRLDSLAKRTRYSNSKVIQTALKIYEEELDTYGESISN